MTLRYCYFHDNNNGILVNASATSDILVEYCEFSNNGYTNVTDNPGGIFVGYAHNMYIGNVRTFTLRYSYSHDSRQGHLVKSRANTSYILYNRITEQTGQGSYQVQFAQGGLSFVVGNLIEKGVNAVNHARIISYSDEGTKNTVQSLYVANNTFVSDLAAYSPTFVCIDSSAPSPSGKIVNNLFIGSGAMTNGVGAMVSTNNLALTLAQSTQLVNRAGYDYHLVSFAAAIDKGVAPGVYSNFNLTPVYHYVHPTNSEPRPVEAALDLGAYESTDANGNGIEDNWERRYFGSLTNTNGAATADPDHDGVNNKQEYMADTDPTNSASFLAFNALLRTNGGTRLSWKGGTSVWQYVEHRHNLISTGETWTVVVTNPPPMTTTNSLILSDPPDALMLYRLRAVRP